MSWFANLVENKVLHTVEIQKKEPIEPMVVQNDLKTSDYWIQKANALNYSEFDTKQSRMNLLPNETYEEFDARREKIEEEWNAQRQVKLLHYQDGGLPANRQSYGCNFFQTFFQAYNHHGELVLSPDDIWMMVQLSFSKYINENPERAEKLRSKLVTFNGKKEIAIGLLDFDLNNLDWDIFTQAVCKEMTDLLQPNVMKEVIGSFSCTRPFDALISRTIVMDCFQAFFEYVCRMSCGISRVHFLGTQQDWGSLPTKLLALAKYDEEGENGSWTKYVKNLVPILTKLAQTYVGQVDVSWWNGVIDHRHERGYFLGGEAELSGWALKFYYGVEDKVELVSDIPAMFARVPVTIDLSSYKIDTQLFTGFTGVAVALASDNDRQVFRPQKSFAVIQQGC